MGKLVSTTLARPRAYQSPACLGPLRNVGTVACPPGLVLPTLRAEVSSLTQEEEGGADWGPGMATLSSSFPRADQGRRQCPSSLSRKAQLSRRARADLVAPACPASELLPDQPWAGGKASRTRQAPTGPASWQEKPFGGHIPLRPCSPRMRWPGHGSFLSVKSALRSFTSMGSPSQRVAHLRTMGDTSRTHSGQTEGQRRQMGIWEPGGGNPVSRHTLLPHLLLVPLGKEDAHGYLRHKWGTSRVFSVGEGGPLSVAHSGATQNSSVERVYRVPQALHFQDKRGCRPQPGSRVAPASLNT